MLHGRGDREADLAAMADTISVQAAFRMLGLSPKDGWNEPRREAAQSFQEYEKVWNDAMTRWLKDNADTYHIRRFVHSGE